MLPCTIKYELQRPPELLFRQSHKDCSRKLKEELEGTKRKPGDVKYCAYEAPSPLRMALPQEQGGDEQQDADRRNVPSE